MTRPRALVVVASQTQGLLLKLLLEEQGIDAGYADGMAAAVAELTHSPADLLLVDASTTGPEDITGLRRRSQAPAILLTGAPDGRALPPDVHPMDPADPHAIVRRALSILEPILDLPGALPTATDIFHRARILIVDDSATYREFLRAELEDEGCNVATARDAEEGAAALEEGDLDCVILDLVMPGTSGTELCERFDRFRRRRGLLFQIVILTSQETEEKLMASIHAGADDFVGKSQPMDVLKIRLMALLRRKYFVEDRLLQPAQSFGRS